MADKPPLKDDIFHSCSRVSTISKFGEGSISSSESPAPSGSGVSEIVSSFRTLWIGKGLLPISCFGFRPSEAKVVEGPLPRPPSKVGACTARASSNPKPMLAKPEPWEPYPDPKSSPVSASFSLSGSWPYPVSWIGPMSSPEQGTDLFRIKPTRCSSVGLGISGSFPEH